MTGRPLIAVTMGDPAGIGPEIVVKSLVHDHSTLAELCLPVVVGDVGVISRTLVALGIPIWTVHTIEHTTDATGRAGVIEVLQAGPVLGAIQPGVVQPAAGAAAVAAVRTAAGLVRSGAAAAMATAPLNKAAMHAAGIRFPGHTELLAHEFGVGSVSLALGVDGLYVLHATTHVSMRQAIDLVTTERVLATIELAHGLARSLGTPEAEIAVLGLNPHAGEDRLFGDEDADRIAPAVAAAQARGIPAVGPLPGDAALPQAFRGRWRFVVAMYHDQGHVAFKSVAGDRGVNITAGLPGLRTSVDHGTAFDIAGAGIARHESMTAAITLAAELAPRWGH